MLLNIYYEDQWWEAAIFDHDVDADKYTLWFKGEPRTTTYVCPLAEEDVRPSPDQLRTSLAKLQQAFFSRGLKQLAALITDTATLGFPWSAAMKAKYQALPPAASPHLDCLRVLFYHISYLNVIYNRCLTYEDPEVNLFQWLFLAKSIASACILHAQLTDPNTPPIPLSSLPEVGSGSPSMPDLFTLLPTKSHSSGTVEKAIDRSLSAAYNSVRTMSKAARALQKAAATVSKDLAQLVVPATTNPEKLFKTLDAHYKQLQTLNTNIRGSSSSITSSFFMPTVDTLIYELQTVTTFIRGFSSAATSFELHLDAQSFLDSTPEQAVISLPASLTDMLSPVLESRRRLRKQAALLSNLSSLPEPREAIPALAVEEILAFQPAANPSPAESEISRLLALHSQLLSSYQPVVPVIRIAPNDGSRVTLEEIDAHIDNAKKTTTWYVPRDVTALIWSKRYLQWRARPETTVSELCAKKSHLSALVTETFIDPVITRFLNTSPDVKSVAVKFELSKSWIREAGFVMPELPDAGDSRYLRSEISEAGITIVDDKFTGNVSVTARRDFLSEFRFVKVGGHYQSTAFPPSLPNTKFFAKMRVKSLGDDQQRYDESQDIESFLKCNTADLFTITLCDPALCPPLSDEPAAVVTRATLQSLLNRIRPATSSSDSDSIKRKTGINISLVTADPALANLGLDGMADVIEALLDKVSNFDSSVDKIQDSITNETDLSIVLESTAALLTAFNNPPHNVVSESADRVSSCHELIKIHTSLKTSVERALLLLDSPLSSDMDIRNVSYSLASALESPPPSTPGFEKIQQLIEVAVAEAEPIKWRLKAALLCVCNTTSAPEERLLKLRPSIKECEDHRAACPTSSCPELAQLQGMIQKTRLIIAETTESTTDVRRISQDEIQKFEEMLERVRACPIKINVEEKRVELRVDELKWQKDVGSMSCGTNVKFADLERWTNEYEDLLEDIDEDNEMTLAPETTALAEPLVREYKDASVWVSRVMKILSDSDVETTDDELKKLVSHPTTQSVDFGDTLVELNARQELSIRMKKVCDEVVFSSLRANAHISSLVTAPTYTFSASSLSDVEPFPDHRKVSDDLERLKTISEKIDLYSLNTPEADLIEWYTLVLEWILQYSADVGYKKVAPNRNAKSNNGVGFSVAEAVTMLKEGSDILTDYEVGNTASLLKKTTGFEIIFEKKKLCTSPVIMHNGGMSFTAFFGAVFNAMQKDCLKGQEWERVAGPYFEDPNLDRRLYTSSREDRELIEKELRELLKSAKKMIFEVSIDIRETLADVVRGEHGGGFNSDDDGWSEDESDSDEEPSNMVLDSLDDPEDGKLKENRKRKMSSSKDRSEKKKKKKLKRAEAEKKMSAQEIAEMNEKQKIERQLAFLANNRQVVEKRDQLVSDSALAQETEDIVNQSGLDIKYSRFFRTEEPKKVQDKTRSIFENVLYDGHARMASRVEGPNIAYCVMLALDLEGEIAVQYPVGKDYKEKVSSLRFNLSDPNNPLVVARFLAGKIEVKQLVAMTSEEIASESVRRSREDAKLEWLKDRVLTELPSGTANSATAEAKPSVSLSEYDTAGASAREVVLSPRNAQEAKEAALAAAGISSEYSFEFGADALSRAGAFDPTVAPRRAPAEPSTQLLEDMADDEAWVPEGYEAAEDDEEEDDVADPGKLNRYIAGSADIFDPREFAPIKSKGKLGKYTVFLPKVDSDPTSVDSQFGCYMLLAKNSESLNGRRPLMEDFLPEHNRIVGTLAFDAFLKFFKPKIDKGTYTCVCIKLSVATCSPEDKLGFKSTYKSLEKAGRVGMCQALAGKKEEKGVKTYIIPPKYAPRIAPLKELGCTNTDNAHTGAVWLLYFDKKKEIGFRDFKKSDEYVELELNRSTGAREQTWSPVANNAMQINQVQSALDFITQNQPPQYANQSEGRGLAPGAMPDWLTSSSAQPSQAPPQMQFRPPPEQQPMQYRPPTEQQPMQYRPPTEQQAMQYRPPTELQAMQYRPPTELQPMQYRPPPELPSGSQQTMQFRHGLQPPPLMQVPPPPPNLSHPSPPAAAFHHLSSFPPPPNRHSFVRDPDDQSRALGPSNLHHLLANYSSLLAAWDYDNANRLEIQMKAAGILVSKRRNLYRLDELSLGQFTEWNTQNGYRVDRTMAATNAAPNLSVYAPPSSFSPPLASFSPTPSDHQQFLATRSTGATMAQATTSAPVLLPPPPPPHLAAAQPPPPQPHALLEKIAELCSKNDAMLEQFKIQKGDVLPFLYRGHRDFEAFCRRLKSLNPNATVE
jgi:hypothetical protein